MQIQITISDDGDGINVSSNGTAVSSSAGAAVSRPNVLPESWWSEARQIYTALQDALARNDMSGVRSRENWLGGLLKAAVLIYPGLDHSELMTEIMLSIQPKGPSYEGIGTVVYEPPLPEEAPPEARAGAQLLVRQDEPMRRTVSDLSELGDLPEDWEEPAED